MHRRSRPSGRRSTTSCPIADPPAPTSRLRALIDGLPADVREAVLHALLVGRRAVAGRTSGWSSWATACSGWRSPTTCIAAFPTGPRASWRGCGRTSCRARAAPLVADDLGLAADLAARGRRARRDRRRRRHASRRPSAAAARRGGDRRLLPRARRSSGWPRPSSRRSADGWTTPSSSTSTTRPSSRRSSHVGARSVTYVVAETSGPPHQRAYTSVAMVGGARARPRLRLEQEGVRAAQRPARRCEALRRVVARTSRARARGRCT